MRQGTALAIVAALTLAGGLIRLLVGRGLSIDEIRAVERAHQSFGSLLAQSAHHGPTPPLFGALEWLSVHVLGGTDLAARVPALLAGVLLIPATAWLAGELFDRRTAVIAGLLAAVAPALVWYSQSAGPYELVALFGTLAAVGAARAIRLGGPSNWVLHAVAASLALWSDWSGLFIVLALEVVLAAAVSARRRRQQPLRPFLLAWGWDSIALGVQLVVLGSIFATQLHNDGGLTGVMGVAASGVSFYSGVSNVSWGLFGFHPDSVTSVLSAVWPLAMLGSLVLVGRGATRRGSFLLTCVAAPVLGVFVLGVAAPHAFDVRFLIAAVPFVLVLLARAAMHWPRGATGRTLVAGSLVLLLGAALLDQQLDSRNPRRFDYRRAAAAVAAQAPPRTAIFYAPRNLRLALARYAPHLRARSLTTRIPTRARAREVIVMSSFNGGDPGLTALMNRDLGALRATRRLVRYHGYPGVDVWEYR